VRTRASVVLVSILTLVGAREGQQPVNRRDWMVSSPSTRLRVVKRFPGRPQSYPSASDYMRILERFPAYAERGWRDPAAAGHPIGFFGDPDHAEMGLRSMGNVVFVAALLATDAAYDPNVTGVSRLRVLARARECLAYMTRGHVTGDLACADGRKWGDHWQSAWWTAKMALGARLIWAYLTEAEREAVRRVVVHEADRHLERQAPSGQLSNTRSEENAWDTEVLAAALALFPDHEHARAWRRKLIEFAANTLSAPQDRTSDTLLDGRPVPEVVYTTNIHSDFTIENHGAFHTCYMACPLHSLAWDHLALAGAGGSVPEALLHHYGDVWRALKPLFLRRRFAYPAGKDWPRYAYGMSFIMPALVVVQQRFADRDARAIEAERVRTFEQEQLANADGSFFGRRFTRNVMMDRWAEYETDAYANLAAAYALHRQANDWSPARSSGSGQTLDGAHVSRESGFAYVRYRGVFASMAWRRLDGPYPAAHFLRIAAEDMAEWGPNNLLGRIAVAGVDPGHARTDHRDTVTASRLRSSGSISYADQAGRPLYTHSMSFDADAARRTAIVEYSFTADGDIRVTSAEGLRLHVANDFFNGYRRRWRHAEGAFSETWSPPQRAPATETITVHTLGRRWVNLDDQLGIRDLGAGERSFALRVSDRANGPWGSVHYSVLDCPLADSRPRAFRRGDVILEGRFMIVVGDARRTRLLPPSATDRRTPDRRDL